MSNRTEKRPIDKKRLSKARAKEIRKIANSRLSKFGYKDAAIDITKFAQFLGADVKYAPYDDGDLAGMLVRGQENRPTIAVNSSHHPNRRRFTIAHECGHLLLHDQDVFVDEKLSVRMRDENSALAVSIEEIEANQFAAEVLMPYSNLMKDIDDINFDIEDDSDTIALAKKYKVSRQAMSYRVYNLVSNMIFSR